MARAQRLIQLVSLCLTVAIIQGSPLNGLNKRAVNPENGGSSLISQEAHPTHVNDRTIALVGQAAQAVGDSFKSKGMCAICIIAVTLTVDKVRQGVSEDGIRELLTSQCKTYHIQEPAVCDGIIALYAPEIVYIANRTTLSSSQICSFAFTQECGTSFDDNHDWTVPIPKGKPPVELIEPSAEGHRLKVLHISDTHMDPYYAPGSLASCALPLCCRLTSSPQESGKKQRLAGQWGDYGSCDTPESLLRSALEHSSREHPDIDYILWTGDILPHDIWNQTREESISIIRRTTQLFKEYFPNTPIYPALGNHEGVPVNSFAPSDVAGERFSMSWLYDELAEQWPKLTSSISGTVTELVKKAAFYSVLVRSNLRIISVNTNFCNDKNWWLILNNEDPERELLWLIKELLLAEAKGEKVHIIGHIPPGSIECRVVWSRNFDLIVNRFESTIKALFYGHTHNDEFELFFDRTTSSLRPTAIAYLGPSVTPFGGGNPSYRIYSIDGEHPETTWSVIDHDTWWMDLEAANNGYTPIWRRLYNAIKAYKLKSLSPASWAKLVRDMATDDKLFDLYYKFYQRDSPRREKCDVPCRRRMLCDLLSGRSKDTTTCQVIWRVFDAAHPSSSWLGLLFGTDFATSKDDCQELHKGFNKNFFPIPNPTSATSLATVNEGGVHKLHNADVDRRESCLTIFGQFSYCTCFGMKRPLRSQAKLEAGASLWSENGSCPKINFLPLEEVEPVANIAVNTTALPTPTPSPSTVTEYQVGGSDTVVLLDPKPPSRGVLITPTVFLVVVCALLLRLH